jgi:hypothetical protein
MAAEEQWRTDLRQRMEELKVDVDEFATSLDGARARLPVMRFRGRTITTCEGSRRGHICDTYSTLTVGLETITRIVASMRRVEQRALIEASGAGDPAVPLVSVDDFHGRDHRVWMALIRLKGGKRLLAHTARGFVNCARVGMLAAGRVLTSLPRPLNVRARIRTYLQGAADSLRSAHALAMNCGSRLDDAVAAIGPVPVPVFNSLEEGDAALPAVDPVEGDAALPAVQPEEGEAALAAFEMGPDYGDHTYFFVFDEHGVAVPPPDEDDDGVAVPPPDEH